MKTAIVSNTPEEVARLLATHHDFFHIVERDPELVVSYGGDGTLMVAEHRYPGVPKLFLKNSHVAKLGHPSKDNDAILQHVVRGEYTIEGVMKIEAEAAGQTLVALNDIVLHNQDPRHGIRYTVSVDGASQGGEIIGDGIICATPLGSTGYYRSITDSSFETGIGLAFNNSTEQSDHIVLKEHRVIEVRVTRGPAVLYADNQERAIALSVGDRVVMRKSNLSARIVRV